MASNDAASQAPDAQMKIDPQRAAQLTANLTSITRSVQAANPTSQPVRYPSQALLDQPNKSSQIRLVAVSKLKPASDILSLSQSPSSLPASATSSSSDTKPSSSPQQPHLHFGENYTQELLHKASILPKSIRWHFIGALQTNKCRTLASRIPNLWAVESVDTAKKADELEKGRRALFSDQSEAGSGRAKTGRDDGSHVDGQGPRSNDADSSAPVDGNTSASQDRLRVFVQVNTSGEDSKSGVAPGTATLDLCRHIRERCPHLQLQGLMTIGALARSVASSSGAAAPNEDFEVLRREREFVVRELGLEGEDGLELSMGMSRDFEEAIRMGSGEVRVGSQIFGERPPKGAGKEG